MIERRASLATQPQIAILCREKCEKIAGYQWIRWWVGKWFKSRAVIYFQTSRASTRIFRDQTLHTKPAIFQHTKHLVPRSLFQRRNKYFPPGLELKQFAVRL